MRIYIAADGVLKVSPISSPVVRAEAPSVVPIIRSERIASSGGGALCPSRSTVTRTSAVPWAIPHRTVPQAEPAAVRCCCGRPSGPSGAGLDPVGPARSLHRDRGPVGTPQRRPKHSNSCHSPGLRFANGFANTSSLITGRQGTKFLSAEHELGPGRPPRTGSFGLKIGRSAVRPRPWPPP